MGNTDEIVTKKKAPAFKMQNGFMVVGTVVRKVRPAKSDSTNQRRQNNDPNLSRDEFLCKKG